LVDFPRFSTMRGRVASGDVIVLAATMTGVYNSVTSHWSTRTLWSVGNKSCESRKHTALFVAVRGRRGVPRWLTMAYMARISVSGFSHCMDQGCVSRSAHSWPWSKAFYWTLN